MLSAKGYCGVGELCTAFGKSRQGYYWNLRNQARKRCDEERVIQLVLEIRRLLPMLGGKKLYHMLRDRFVDEGLKIGRDRLFEILRKSGLLVQRRRHYARTTDSRHGYRKFRDSYNGLKIKHPEEVFVSDITYIRTDSDFSYACFVVDAYSRKIMGYNVRRDLGVHLTLDALKMAVSQRQYDCDLLFHSDRGIQYCTQDQINYLKKHGIKISMTESGDPRDNAIAERVNGIFKQEFGLGCKIRSHNDVKELVADAVELYNNLRPHWSCEMMTPEMTHSRGKTDSQNRKFIAHLST